jgi:hypothetical protein
MPLMHAMLEFARSERRLLCMGGLPRYGDEGLLRFKIGTGVTSSASCCFAASSQAQSA